mmetsp:Transcript_20054/g.69613  ORF Transcript_20054/g.69613 Transcript_20054/m.69613 type:complete len:208 (+) Transcript_20054:392-1015(+)
MHFVEAVSRRGRHGLHHLLAVQGVAHEDRGILHSWQRPNQSTTCICFRPHVNDAWHTCKIRLRPSQELGGGSSIDDRGDTPLHPCFCELLLACQSHGLLTDDCRRGPRIHVLELCFRQRALLFFHDQLSEIEACQLREEHPGLEHQFALLRPPRVRDATLLAAEPSAVRYAPLSRRRIDLAEEGLAHVVRHQDGRLLGERCDERQLP